MLKLALLFVGLLTLGFIVWHIGPERIYDAAAQLGPVALIVLLIPSTIMYVIEAYGWKVTLGPSAKDLPFWRVFAIKTAGEVVNLTTPAGYIGGEPLKAYLLTKHHVPMVEGLASVVIAKTTKTIAEVLFIFLGIMLAFRTVDSDGSLGQTVFTALISVSLLVFVTASLVFAQREGFFTWLLKFTRKIGLKIRFLEAREEKLRSLDRMIVEYYRDQTQKLVPDSFLTHYFLQPRRQKWRECALTQSFYVVEATSGAGMDRDRLTLSDSRRGVIGGHSGRWSSRFRN
jgi:uncharacterized protein (TIRG00374 family)